MDSYPGISTKTVTNKKGKKQMRNTIFQPAVNKAVSTETITNKIGGSFMLSDSKRKRLMNSTYVVVGEMTSLSTYCGRRFL